MIISILLASVAMLPLLAQTAGAAAGSAITIESAMAIINVGLAGLGLIGFIRGWIVPGSLHKTVVDENTRKQKLIEENLIPELIRSRESQEKVLELSSKLIETYNQAK